MNGFRADFPAFQNICSDAGNLKAKLSKMRKKLQGKKRKRIGHVDQGETVQMREGGNVSDWWGGHGRLEGL